jgi:hypothetical protein
MEPELIVVVFVFLGGLCYTVHKFFCTTKAEDDFEIFGNERAKIRHSEGI